MAPATKILTGAVAKRRRARQLREQRLERRIREQIGRLAPALRNGDAGAGLSKDGLINLLQSLRDMTGVEEIKRSRRILRRVLIELRDLTGGAVELPAMEVMLHRPTSPFTPQKLKQTSDLSRLVVNFTTDLRNQPQVDTERAAVRILFSAIVFGGLLHQKLVDGFGDAITTSLSAHENLCWIDIPLDGANDTGLVRRWFPDPITQCLILRWRSKGVAWPKHGKVSSLVRAFLKELAASDAHTIVTLPALLAASETRFRLRMPGILVDFLTSVRRGQSLSSRAWWRILCDFHLDEEDPDHEPEPDPLTELSLDDPGPPVGRQVSSGAPADDLMVLSSLKTAFRSGDHHFLKRTAAIRALEEVMYSASSAGPMVRMVMGWSIWRLRGGTGSSPKPSSVHRYLNSFAKVLIALAGEVDPGAVTADVLEDKYAEVLASIVNTKERYLASYSLRTFHQFLMATEGVEPASIDGISSGIRGVRANTLSDHEFARSLEEIQKANLPERRKCMLELILIFLYRLGLRRNELTHLRLTDIQKDDRGLRPLLWVHSHRKAGLKTDSSTRRLPLGHLLTEREWQMLQDWQNRRSAECETNPSEEALLFCLDGENSERMPDREIDLLVTVIRHVTQDPTLVLHSLRHAFACNLFCDIMLAGWQAARNPDLQSRSDAVARWRVDKPHPDPLKGLFVAEYMPRGAAYLISTIAGHLDPTETLHSYTHFQDYVAHRFIRDMASTHDKTLWAALEGISPEVMLVRHSRSRRKTGTAVLAHCDTPDRLLSRASINKPPGAYPARSASPSILDELVSAGIEQLGVDGIYRALATSTRFMSNLKRETLTGIDNDTFHRLHRNAGHLASIATNTRQQSARRQRLLTKKPRRFRPPLKQLPQLDGLGPALPRPEKEKSDARRVFTNAASGRAKVKYMDLMGLLRRTSRSDPAIVHDDIKDLKASTAVLSSLGIPHDRLHVVVRSIPTGCTSAEKWLKTVRRQLKAKVGLVELARDADKMPKSHSLHVDGLLALRVVRDGRQSYGWRVGTFYALCVMATEAHEELSLIPATLSHRGSQGVMQLPPPPRRLRSIPA